MVAMSDPDDRRPARIKDVAALAGVSLKTVTNVVHQRPYVKAETRRRVLAAIEELDYRPSMAGRQLQSGRSNILTLAVPRIDEPYLGSLAHALIAAATPRGYTVLIDETGGSPSERAGAEGYPGHGIDGVIFSPLALDPQHLAAISRKPPSCCSVSASPTARPTTWPSTTTVGKRSGRAPAEPGPPAFRLPRRPARSLSRGRRAAGHRRRPTALRIRNHPR